MPEPDARERHAIVVRAPAAVVFAAAERFDFQSVSLIRGILRLREVLLRSSKQERRPAPFLQEALAMGWGVLAKEPGRLFVAGAHCQPWLGNVTFTPIAAADFAGYHEANQVKIAWTVEVEVVDASTSRLITETRAVATDHQSRRRFRRYWRWARFGIISIRWLMLPAIRRAAERDWRARSASHRSTQDPRSSAQ